MAATKAAPQHNHEQTRAQTTQPSPGQAPDLRQTGKVTEPPTLLLRYFGNSYVQSLPTGGKSSQDAIISPSVHEVLRSSGQPLDPTTRSFMESYFSHDFSQVRVHSNGQAAASARALSSSAYTVGQDIVFGKGKFSPGTSTGRHLLAHELAHVVQQQRAGGATTPGISSRQDPFEDAADMAAQQITKGRVGRDRAMGRTLLRTGSGAPPAVQRFESEEAERERVVDETRAATIELFHADSALGLGGDIEELIRKADKLHFIMFNYGPRTRIAGAKALVKIFALLQQLEQTAPRDTDGALLFNRPFYGDPKAWTPERPRRVEEIPLFSPDNVKRWRRIAAVVLPPSHPKRVRSRRVASSPVATPEALRRPAGGGIAIVKKGKANAVVLWDFVKTTGMSLKTSEGRAKIVATVIRIINKSKYRYSQDMGEEEALDIARKLLAKNAQINPRPGETAGESAEMFERLPVGSEWPFEVHQGFLKDLSRYLVIPRDFLEVQEEPKEQGEEDSEEQEKAKTPSPVFQWVLPTATPEQRLQFAIARVRDTSKSGLSTRYRPGQPQSDGRIFIYHPSGSHDDQVYLLPDGRLVRVNERDLHLEIFRNAVLKARGAVMMGYIMVAAVTAFLVAPAALEAIPALATELKLLVLTNPELALELAGLGLSTAFQIGEMGWSGFVESLSTPEGIAQLLYDILVLRALRGNVGGVPSSPKGKGSATTGGGRLPGMHGPLPKADLGKQISHGGDIGSLGYRSPGRLGVFEGTMRHDKTKTPMAVKVYPDTPEFDDMFQLEMRGAQAVSRTSQGPRFHGEVDVGPGRRGFAMERVRGGFPEAEPSIGSPTPKQQREARKYQQKISERTLKDVETFGEELVQKGHYYSGEVQGLIDKRGRYRPIDFQGVRQLPKGGKPSKATRRAERIEEHRANVQQEIERLRELREELPETLRARLAQIFPWLKR